MLIMLIILLIRVIRVVTTGQDAKVERLQCDYLPNRPGASRWRGYAKLALRRESLTLRPPVLMIYRYKVPNKQRQSQAEFILLQLTLTTLIYCF